MHHYKKSSKSILTVGFFTALSRLFGLVRDMLFSRVMGISFFADAFFIALRLPNIFRRITSDGAFSASFIPIFSREISISYLRLFIVSQSKNMDEIKSDLIGKYKTTFQMLGLGFLLISPLLSSTFFNVSLGLIFFSAFMSWYSLARYLKQWIV